MEGEKEDDDEEKIVDAREVYVLMHDRYRISRNARANWYFKHLNRVVKCKPQQWEQAEELQILWACAVSNDVLPAPVSDGDDGPERLMYRVGPNTKVVFLAKMYRFVFMLDLSPSVSAVDLSSSTVLYEELFKKLKTALRSLVKPYQLPGCDIKFLPNIYVTVVAHMSLINCKNNQVLLQGCLVTEDNLGRILDEVKRDLDVLESNMADRLGETLDIDYLEAEDEQRITFGLFEDIERPDSPDPSAHIMSPEASFINILRYGILALQLLPENSTAGIVVITDGVVGVPDHSLFESLMMQLRHTTVSCSFLQLGRGFQIQAGLGHVPYTELLEYIAAATMGTYFDDLREESSPSEGMTPIQHALITQTFQRLDKATDSLGGDFLTIDTPRLSNTYPLPTDKLMSSLHTRKHREKNLHVPISTVISCRLREGFFIKDVAFTKGDSQIEIQMVLPWRSSVNVLYSAVSVWPLNNLKRHTHIDVSVEGTYDFLRDMTCHLKQKPVKCSSFRTGLVKRYWQNLQGMSETDELLVHLQSFSTNTAYYKVSDSLKQGIPLFYLPANQTSPHVNTQLCNKDSALNQFATFWKPVLMLDINIWQKWMHTHRLGFILEHDVPFGKHLHLPNSSGRFHNVTSRQAASALNFFLRDYSTFVLMENHSYVTLLFNEPDKPPWSFFVIRVASKPPCMVLRLAFLGGTPGDERNRIILDLKERLAYLKRHHVKDDHGNISIQRKGSRPDLDKEHVPPLQRPSSEIPCCVLTSKPIEKILIRYERMPQDFSTLHLSPLGEHSSRLLPVSANKTAFSMYTTLSRYLYHRRWVWSVQHGADMPVSMQAIGRILANLTKIRLQEGFHVAHTYSGIVNLTVEFDMKNPEHDEDEDLRTEDEEDGDVCYPCVVQYVVFPPHTTTTRGSVSSEDPEDMDTAEADGELQVITECWVEPQWGAVTRSAPECGHYDGAGYRDIARQMFPVDLDIISTMITFEHLNLMCQSTTVPSPLPIGTPPLPTLALVEEDYLSSMSPEEESISAVPFPFDLLRLLPKSQQVELLFSTYIQEPETSDRSRSSTLTKESPAPSSPRAPSPPAPPPGSPNETLFSLFLESLGAVHDREISLTDLECEELVKQITARDRDKHPLPFVPRQHRLVTEEDIKNSGSTFQRSESALSLSTSLSVSSQPHQGGSQSGLQRLTSSGNINRIVSPVAGREAEHDSVKQDDAPGVPRWKCFVRSLTSTHMMLCFVPASFKDLVQLVDPSEVDMEQPQQKTTKRGSLSNVTSPSSTDNLRLNKSEPASPAVLTTDAQPALTPEKPPERPPERPPEALYQQTSSPSVGPAVKLPVYIYNCPLSTLSERLVNHWTFSVPPDIYEDLSLATEGHNATHAEFMQDQQDEVFGTRTRKISEMDLGQQEGTPDDLYHNARDLKTHCTMVSETYLRCFVKGLFESLQTGCRIHPHDIESAINEICEEALPLELDISEFLQCSCGHVRCIVEKANLERMLRDDWSKTMMGAGGGEKGAEEGPGDDSNPGDPSLPPEDPTPCGESLPLYFPLSKLEDDSPCEAGPDLHAQTRHQFGEIFTRYFRPVADSMDYYYFCPPRTQAQNVPAPEDLVYPDPPDHDREHKSTVSSDSILLYDDLAAHTHDSDLGDTASITSNKDSVSTLSHLSDDDDDDLYDPDLHPTVQARPLFVQLACSVKVRNSQLMRSVPIRNIPMCYNEIQECLYDLDPTIDLHTVRVTLDVICLTLPAEEDLAETPQRPCYTRMTSHTSSVSFAGSSGPEDGGDTDDTLAMEEAARLQRSMGADPLAHLPEPQRESVLLCKEQVLWLLRDEITSIMRSIVPVTTVTLDMVTNHIAGSSDKTTCNTKIMPLKFVGGADVSLQMFVEDFERMNLPGFHLNREGEYYYLSVDRAYGYNQAHAQALQNALSHLDYAGISPELKELLVATSGNKGDADGKQPEAKTEGDVDTKPDHKPSLPHKLFLEDLKSETATEVGLKPDSEHKAPLESKADLEAESIQVLCLDPGLEVITEQRSPEIKGRTTEVSPEAKEAENFRAEDIRISVTRPSPVKEVPGKPSDLLDVRAKEEDADEKGYMSDKSSGSSIQVLDDKTECDAKPDNSSKPPAETQFPPTRRKSKDTNEPVETVAESKPPEKREELVHIRTRNLSGRSGHSSRHSSGGRSVDTVLGASQDRSKDDAALASRGLSPLTVMGMDVERKTIRRVHSSASFEKYKHDKSGARRSGGGSQGWATPQRRPSETQTPSRSRHHSGLQTPMSTIETSSRGSVGDDGYDGDSSDPDDDGAMLSFNETQTLRKPILPDFWLIMRIHLDQVKVYFHTRDSREADQDNIVCYKSLYNQVVTKIVNTCSVVNQKLLLDVLYTTRMCDKLLVPEADEEVVWGKDDSAQGTPKYKHDMDSDDSDGEGPEKIYFDATRDTKPGHFACEEVWQRSFVLHPRLKTGPGRGGMSRGIQTLRSAVLNKFSVNNRKNMFVIKENSTGSVFYMRLEDTPGDVIPMSTSENPRGDDFSLSASRSSSIMSLNIRKNLEAEDEVFSSPKTFDKGSTTTLSTMTESRKPSLVSRQKSEDIITLSVHGIGPVGPEISKYLVELLQKKLDDAVLKFLTEILARNPMCKLTPEDVVFIQRPHSAPQKTLAFTIPPSAMLQQFALSYYLRQNLSQVVHTPKYMDPRPELVFQDYTHSPPRPMEDDCTFLYNRPQLSGGNGIACLYLSFVDSKGRPIQLITSPKPSCGAYKDHIDPGTFESLVNTSVYEIQEKSPAKGPGPMALIQFTIWSQGTVDMSALTDHLHSAVSHAVCDVITEYRLLTAPVCEPPDHYARGLDTPTYSAPASPGLGHGLESRHSVSSSDIKKQMSEGGEKTPKDKQVFSLQAIMSDIFTTKGRDNSKDDPEDGQPTWQELERNRRRRQELREKIQRYEGGEKGTLLPMYYRLLGDWLSFCYHLKLPTVTKQSLTLMSRFPVDYILKDLAAAVNAVSQDIVPRTFKLVDGCERGEPIYLPYTVSRTPLGSHEKSESSLDLACLHSRSPHTPGSASSFVMIGRNTKQWRASIDYPHSGDDNMAELPSLTNPKTHKSYQRYKPLEPEESSDRPEASGVSSVDRSDRAFIPRQRLLLVTVHDKQITMYMYNWATELCTNLERQLLRYVQWHNARSQVLLAICSQKMGLFRHNHLRDTSLGDRANIAYEPNHFSQSHSEMDLVKFTCPSGQPTPSRGGPRGLGGGSRAGGNPYDEVYRDHRPTHPMAASLYAKLRDPVHRHGAQLLEHANYVKKENEKKMSLQKLYLDWQQRMTIPNIQIPEDLLALLKRSSRLVHSVATPFMFSPHWRKKILDHHKRPKKPEVQRVESVQPRSRHSSGASIKSRRSGSVDGGSRWRSQSSVDSPEVAHRPSSAVPQYQEEAWHQQLRESFLTQYSQYLQHLGILPIKTRPPANIRRLESSSGQNKKAERFELKPRHTYMQKTQPGGIMLLELGFTEEYFSINVYAFEVTSLPVAKNINPHLAVMFTDECEKLKDQTHAHSFSHDFHLAQVLGYIHGSQHTSLTRPHYHVTGFLRDFVQQFSYAPNYTQNYVYESCLVIRHTNSPGQQLFDYMLQHDAVYNMKKIKMFSAGDGDMDQEEFALVSVVEHPSKRVFPGDDPPKVCPEDYLLALVIAHDYRPLEDGLGDCLRLRYWVVLVNNKVCLPSGKMERRRITNKVSSYPADMSSYRCRSSGDVLTSHSSVDLAPAPGPSPPQPRGPPRPDTPPLETLNYLGYSNAHQLPVHELLVREAGAARDTILQMVNRTMTHCRRDLLWQRMLLGEMDEGEGRRKRHKTGDPIEVHRGMFMTKLSYSEFREMIDMVNRVQISDIDPQLKPLETMSAAWYTGLSRNLVARYSQTIRCFSNRDKTEQHYVVVNPKHLDMLMMLSIDHNGGKNELCFVFKEQESASEQVRSDEHTRLLALELFENFINTCLFHMWTGLL